MATPCRAFLVLLKPFLILFRMPSMLAPLAPDEIVLYGLLA